MGIQEVKNIIVPYIASTQNDPDLELGLIDGKRIIREDERFGFVRNAGSPMHAVGVMEDIEESTGVLLSIGDAIDIDRTVEENRVIKPFFPRQVGLWQRREIKHV